MEVFHYFNGECVIRLTNITISVDLSKDKRAKADCKFAYKQFFIIHLDDSAISCSGLMTFSGIAVPLAAKSCECVLFNACICVCISINMCMGECECVCVCVCVRE